MESLEQQKKAQLKNQVEAINNHQSKMADCHQTKQNFTWLSSTSGCEQCCSFPGQTCRMDNPMEWQRVRWMECELSNVDSPAKMDRLVQGPHLSLFLRGNQTNGKEL